MTFAFSPFGFDPFGKEPSGGATVAAGAGASSGVASAAAYGATVPPAESVGASAATGAGSVLNDPHLAAVVFHADFNPTTTSTTDIVDFAGHTVTRGSYPRLDRADAAVGKGFLRGQGGVVGDIAYISGLSSDFNGFRKTDAWTIEFRVVVNTTWSGDVVTIQDDSGGTPLNVWIGTDSAGLFSITVTPQGTSLGYNTGLVLSSHPTAWRGVTLESDGTTIWAVVDGVPYATTGDSSTSVSTPAAAGFILYGRTLSSAGANFRLDEFRVTKASRYAGSPPAWPWPFFTGREKDSAWGIATGTTSVAAGGDSYMVGTPTPAVGHVTCASTAKGRGRAITQAVGNSAGVAVASGVHYTPVYGSGDGSSVGGSVVVAVGRGWRCGDGSSVGDSSAAGVGSAVTVAAGSSVAAALAIGYTASIQQGVGTSLASGAAIATGKRYVGGRGTCTGTSAGFAVPAVGAPWAERTVMLPSLRSTITKTDWNTYVRR